MIGALLIILGLFIIFITSPPVRRDKYVREYIKKFKKIFRKEVANPQVLITADKPCFDEIELCVSKYKANRSGDASFITEKSNESEISRIINSVREKEDEFLLNGVSNTTVIKTNQLTESIIFDHEILPIVLETAQQELNQPKDIQAHNEFSNNIGPNVSTYKYKPNSGLSPKGEKSNESDIVKIINSLRKKENKSLLIGVNNTSVIKTNQVTESMIIIPEILPLVLETVQQELFLPKDIHMHNEILLDDSKYITAEQIEEQTITKNHTVQLNAFTTEYDDSIIEIGSEGMQIKYESESDPIQEPKTINIPYWSHDYIYSKEYLKQATKEQRSFYKKLKTDFLNEVYIDLLGNTNYAFILLFDLLDEFDNEDIALLESRLRKLAELYYATASYARKFLLEKMRLLEYEEGIERLEHADLLGRQDLLYWDWRNDYKRKLQLSKEDAELLKDIWISNNAFSSIETCTLEILKLYIGIIKALKQSYQEKALNQQTEFNIMLDIIARKQYRYHLNSQNYNYCIAQNGTIYSYLLTYCEQILKNLYGYSKTERITEIPTFEFLEPEASQSVYDHTIAHIVGIIPTLIAAIKPLDEETDIQLNSISSRRWKLKFDLTADLYGELGKVCFIAKVKEILKVNIKNPSKEMIYLEVSKHLSKHNKQLSFEYYLRYIKENQNTNRLILKPMSKTMVKKLFPTPDLLERYNRISTSMIQKTINLSTALEMIKDFYLPVRKKIILDTTAIEQVKEQYTETVEVLNEYLNEESDDETSKKHSTIQNASIQPGPAETKTNQFLIELTSLQINTLALFRENNWTLPACDLDNFCKANGTIKGPLINNINEACYEILDDLFIEQEDQNYTINLTYYHQITIS